ncbi:hypothetical protein KJ836_03970 [Patescibacteria group bacterium]|nr:hypothetical protein [Patescibacteria group bacterium]
METDEKAVEVFPQKVMINLPDGTEWNSDDMGDIGEFLDKAFEFLKSPEFLSKMLPALQEHFVRRHKEMMERLSKEKQKLAQAGKYELQFLINQVIMGAALFGAVTYLKMVGKIATETTIVL